MKLCRKKKKGEKREVKESEGRGGEEGNKGRRKEGEGRVRILGSCNGH